MLLPSARTMTAAIGRRSAQSSWIPILLGFLTAVGPVSTDIYLPAFPELEATLRAPAGSAQMTLAIWFVGLALGQVTMGSLSDRFGRRMPMLLGTIFYTLASVGCALAPDIVTFSVFRLVAALGASASLVIPSAYVRDIAHGNHAAKIMSRLVLVMGVVPIIAPTIGGAVLSVASWRSIFWASAAYGFLCIGVIWRMLPETLDADHRQGLSAMGLIMRYVGLARDRSFNVDALIAGFSAFVTFTYLSAAPGIFIHDFGFTPGHFGMMFGAFAVCMIGASQLNGMLVDKIDAVRMLRIAVGVSAVGAAALTVIAIIATFDSNASGHVRVGMQVPLVLAMMLTLGTTGIIGPNATVGAMLHHPRVAGSASALIGTTQYLLGAVAGGVIGILPSTTPIPMAAVMLTGTVLMLLLLALRSNTTMQKV